MRRSKPLMVSRLYLNATIKVCTWAATGIFGILALLIVSNVLGRALFNQPVPGTVELTELLTSTIVFLAIAYTEQRRQHVSVDLVVTRLPIHMQSVLAIIMSFLCAAYYLILGWRCGALMWSHIVPYRSTSVLLIPIAPFLFVMAFGSFLLGLEILINMLYPRSLQDIKRERL